MVSLRTRSLVELLATRGSQPALLADDLVVSYGDLAQRVSNAAAMLGSERRLVMIHIGPDVESIAWYLAALSGRHPALLVPSGDDGQANALGRIYEPDVVVGPEACASGPVGEPRGADHALHPALAVLLPTSGSTGSPKLAQLSRRNLWSNSVAIARYLKLTPTDRAITTLPLHYCYGLSVINSHLLAGASVVLNRSSVVDQEFWDRFEDTTPTSFAGVPYTFELLDRIGFDAKTLPSLRFMTQAGGRLDPEKVRRYAQLGEDHGWQFFAMYGQTEATARMAYLPPELATSHPTTIGLPIEKGSFEIDISRAGAGEAPCGELIYRGPNVMLGYAESVEDLNKGRTIDALRTGDLARRNEAGLYEIVGRRSRFVKPFGRRIDLDHLQRALDERGTPVAVTGDDTRIVVAGASPSELAQAKRTVGDLTALPSAAIAAAHVDPIPRTGSGKIDYPAILDLAYREATEETGQRHNPAGDLVDMYRSMLETNDVGPDDTFVSLGGDSLNYVRLSAALEDRIGHLPDRWQDIPIAELARSSRHRNRFHRTETTVVLRAIAMVLIVATHSGLVGLPAGAHVLLGVAGYNFARFQLRSARRWPAIARIAIPSALWLGALWLVTDEYGLSSPLLVHNIVGDASWSAPWRYWYIDVIVQLLVGLSLLLSLRPIQRLERASPFGFAAGLVVIALVLRHDLLDVLLSSQQGGRTLTAFWAFAIGWAGAQATTIRQRLAVTAAIPVAALGFYDNDVRIAMIIGGLLALVWVRRVILPRFVIRVAGTISAASLLIYLTHWEVYPRILDVADPLAAAVGSIAAGIVAWIVVENVTKALKSTIAQRKRRSPTGPAPGLATARIGYR